MCSFSHRPTEVILTLGSILKCDDDQELKIDGRYPVPGTTEMCARGASKLSTILSGM